MYMLHLNLYCAFNYQKNTNYYATTSDKADDNSPK